MRTPARLWEASPRRYDPHPPRWEYPAGSWVLKVNCQGKLDIKGTKWRINRSLAGEWVQVVRVEQRMMVFYCTTLIRELDSEAQFLSTNCKGCLGTKRKGCPGTLHLFERWDVTRPMPNRRHTIMY
jgi:hypothetical protein